MSIEQCAYVIRAVCLGLDYVHNCTDSETGKPLNIIHRDVSPQNIMVGFSGDVKVIDFGIAKVNNSEVTRSGVLKGKFEYMSPEQVKGERLDKQTDIFSLGSVFWEMLSGRKLFTGSNEIQILRLIRSCRVPDLRTINPKIPDEVVRIVNKALSPRKDFRYQTMADMANDLSVCLSEQYSKFTHNHFGSFIKDIYVDEILEERQNIKSYMEALRKDEKNLSLHSSSAHYETIEDSSSFIGESTKTQNSSELSSVSEFDDLDIEEEVDGDTENNTASQTLVTENDPVEDITETKFNDDVEPKKALVIKKSSTAFTKSLFDESIEVKDDNPYWKTQSVKLKRKLLRKDKGKKRYQFPFQFVIILIVCALAGGLFFKPVTRMMDRMVIDLSPWKDFFQKNRDIASSQSDSPDSEQSLSQIVSSGTQTQSSKNIKKKVNVKNVFVTTQPSGAQLVIDNKPEKGLTPLTIGIPLGRAIRLTIKKKGYREENRVISSNTKQKRINILLERVEQKQKGPIILR